MVVFVVTRMASIRNHLIAPSRGAYRSSVTAGEGWTHSHIYIYMYMNITIALNLRRPRSAHPIASGWAGWN